LRTDRGRSRADVGSSSAVPRRPVAGLVADLAMIPARKWSAMLAFDETQSGTVGRLLKATRTKSVPELCQLFPLLGQQTDQHFTLSFVRVSCEQATEAFDVFGASESVYTTFLFRFSHCGCHKGRIKPRPRPGTPLRQQRRRRHGFARRWSWPPPSEASRARGCGSAGSGGRPRRVARHGGSGPSCDRGLAH